jgi:hypothetical protein
MSEPMTCSDYFEATPKIPTAVVAEIVDTIECGGNWDDQT